MCSVFIFQYRLESRLEPEDLIHKPSTYGKMRDQVRGVQDKLDRHRQLLDRYLETDSAAAAAVTATHEADPFIYMTSADLGERIAAYVVPSMRLVTGIFLFFVFHSTSLHWCFIHIIILL